MREKRRAKFLKDVAEAARQGRPKPRGRPSPQNMTDEGRQRGLEAIRNAPRCRTIRRNGEQCMCPAMRGATRCVKHGGRVEVPAHPHNIRRYLAGTMTAGESHRRSREAWDAMTLQQQRDFIAMLPAEMRKRTALVIYAAGVWKRLGDDDVRGWQRLVQDLRARMISAE